MKYFQIAFCLFFAFQLYASTNPITPNIPLLLQINENSSSTFKIKDHKIKQIIQPSTQYLKNKSPVNSTSTEPLNQTNHDDLANTSYFHYYYQPSDEHEKEFSRYLELFLVKDIQCSPTSCPRPHRCLSPTICKCGPGFANVNMSNSDTVFHPSNNNTVDSKDYHSYCGYRQKKQIVAFLLELFLPFGIGHFYVGRTMQGLYKLILCITPVILLIYCLCLTITGCDYAKDCGIICLIVSIFVMVISTYIQIVDIYRYATNKYDDGHGIPLMEW